MRVAVAAGVTRAVAEAKFLSSTLPKVVCNDYLLASVEGGAGRGDGGRYPAVLEHEIELAAELVASGVNVKLMVDCAEHVEMIEAAVSKLVAPKRKCIPVVVDVGGHRGRGRADRGRRLLPPLQWVPPPGSPSLAMPDGRRLDAHLRAGTGLQVRPHRRGDGVRRAHCRVCRTPPLPPDCLQTA